MIFPIHISLKLSKKKIRKWALQMLVLFLITNLIFTAWPPKVEKVSAATATIRQEINIIDAIVTASGDDSAIIQIDTTKYSGATYYFETVAQVDSGTLTVALERVRDSTQDATTPAPPPAYPRQRSPASPPPAATQTEYNINLSGGTNP